ncbi:ABC transporter ATP-binding protein [Lentilactobacillus sp. Marseille-Q4993]|uniref:ABC transporter ATP-binding protein n=1 Tax=Lentilactobacillus sp. Marseille-Q4993 TaxID=3039492 RepID=UPI0024BC787B|nr:ABC transporter ATP-binding protein [Lentilactobacillus sp. Marseille-Q4993]
MQAIKLENISKSFGKDSSFIQVLSDINMSTEKGELSLILGPSGAGKSTFLTIAGGLQTPSEGQVYIDDQQIDHMSSKQRDQLRLNNIGFILQSYNLVPYLTVKEQFTLVDKVRKSGNLDKNELADLFQQLGIEKLVNKYPSELSGGQNQRVAIARALYTDSAIVLADEPTAALDSERVLEVGKLFRDLAHSREKSIVIVTHDVRLIEFADNVYHIMDGKITKDEQND